MPTRAAGTRTIALVGPGGAGKTSLAEALLFAAGAIGRQGSVADGSSVGDASPEARARGGSTELNLMHFDYMGDRYALIDCPGSVGFAADGALGAAVADLALVVVDPDPDRALLAEPTLRQLEALGIPHMIFVNKIDQARGSIQALLEALQPMSDVAADRALDPDPRRARRSPASSISRSSALIITAPASHPSRRRSPPTSPTARRWSAARCSRSSPTMTTLCSSNC